MLLKKVKLDAEFRALTKDDEASHVNQIIVSNVTEKHVEMTLSFVDAEINRLQEELDFYTQLRAKVEKEAKKVKLKDETPST